MATRAGCKLRGPARTARNLARSVGGGRREFAIAMGAYGLYSIVKSVFGGTLKEGKANAQAVAALERRLGIFREAEAQRYFAKRPVVMQFWNAFYVVSQVVVLPSTLYLVYRHRRPAYPFVRNLAIISWCGGVVWYALQPVAPPRHAGHAVDTVSTQTPLDLDAPFVRAFYNPVAAMPSLHVGMAPVVAWALVALTRNPATRAVGVAYPGLVATATVATGNHYILDIAGGLAVVLPSAWLARRLTGPVPNAASLCLRGGRRPSRGTLAAIVASTIVLPAWRAALRALRTPRG